MKVSNAGLDLIKKHEGLRLQAYRCPAGVWTIGYGITSRAGVGAVTPGMKITQAEAEDMLRKALAVFERGVQDVITRRPTQAQFDAMVSLAYNIGVPAFRRSSVARHFNNGETDKAANSFALWNKANGKVLPGLTRRRADERAWFLTAAPPAANPPPQRVPEPVVKPPIPNDEPVLRPPADPVVEEKPGKSLAGWILAGLFALIAAAAAFVVKGQ
jgi:lysozyme